ncbi:hypothetical protein GCM10010277_58190 [Streptomyces longisporoflavus]|nr:hypothetical protein GCM10010277_58190 [Streptomyces longisporoflavus]
MLRRWTALPEPAAAAGFGGGDRGTPGGRLPLAPREQVSAPSGDREPREWPLTHRPAGQAGVRASAARRYGPGGLESPTTPPPGAGARAGWSGRSGGWGRASAQE